MLFAGQRTVEFSGANYSGEAFVPLTPYSAYVDEVIYFTDRPSYVNSFMTKFDDVWTSILAANVTLPATASAISVKTDNMRLTFFISVSPRLVVVL